MQQPNVRIVGLTEPGASSARTGCVLGIDMLANLIPSPHHKQKVD